MPPKRMTANPIRPARHRPGKPAGGAPSPSSSEEESEGEEHIDQPETKAPSRAPLPPASSFPQQPQAYKIVKDLRDVSLTTEPRTRPLVQPPVDSDEESEEGSEEESSEEGSSGEEEEESSSEDDTARRKLLRPIFLKKSERNAPAARATNGHAASSSAVDDAVARQKRTDALIQEQLEKNALARAAGKKYWDDEDVVDEVDDTDGLDPAKELLAWKLRELKRVRREREELIAAEKEREEIERRRNLGEEEREREDKEFLEKQKREKEQRGRIGNMQRWFHRGAHFQEELSSAGLDKRDLMGGNYVDQVRNKEALPEFMQIRDMTKLGRKGRTKYKDLKSEDTGRFGGHLQGMKRRDDYGGLDDRFRPDYQNEKGATGANASALGERKRFGDEQRREDKRRRVE